MHVVDIAVELDPAGQIVTLVKVHLKPEGQSVHKEEAPDENVPLTHAVFTPPLQALPASQGVQLVDDSIE